MSCMASLVDKPNVGPIGFILLVLRMHRCPSNHISEPSVVCQVVQRCHVHVDVLSFPALCSRLCIVCPHSEIRVGDHGLHLLQEVLHDFSLAACDPTVQYLGLLAAHGLKPFLVLATHALVACFHPGVTSQLVQFSSNEEIVLVLRCVLQVC